MLAPDHDHAGEGVLQRPGQFPAAGGGPGDDSAQEPARAIHAEEADRLERPAARRPRLLFGDDAGIQFRAEAALRLLGLATGAPDLGPDLLPELVPQAAALRRRLRLLL